VGRLAADAAGLDELRRGASSPRGRGAGAAGVPNRRVQRGLAAVGLLAQRTASRRRALWRRLDGRADTGGARRLWRLGAETSYRVDLSLAGGSATAAFDAVFRRDDAGPACRRWRSTSPPRPAVGRYANNPLQEKLGRALAPSLRESLRRRAPLHGAGPLRLLRALPCTPAGKVDRRSCPRRIIPAASPTARTSPPGPLGTGAGPDLGEVLGIERVGLHDNFFDLGGTSLKATQVVSRIHRDLNVRPRSATSSTIHDRRPGGAARLPESTATSPSPRRPRPSLPAVTRPEAPVGPRAAGGRLGAYNMPAALLLEGSVRADALQPRCRRTSAARNRVACAPPSSSSMGCRMQRILPGLRLHPHGRGLGAAADPEGAARLRALRRRDTRRPTRAGGLLRVSLPALGGTATPCCLTCTTSSRTTEHDRAGGRELCCSRTGARSRGEAPALRAAASRLRRDYSAGRTTPCQARAAGRRSGLLATKLAGAGSRPSTWPPIGRASGADVPRPGHSFPPRPRTDGGPRDRGAGGS
jgi:hypothetical protein